MLGNERLLHGKVVRGELYMVVVKVVEEGVPKSVGISIVLFLMEQIQT